jgi:hypothetical protein
MESTHIIQCFPPQVPMSIASRALEVMWTYAVLLEGCLHPRQVLGHPSIYGSKQWLQVCCTTPYLQYINMERESVTDMLPAIR